MNALVLFEMLVLLLIVAWAVREVVATRRLLRANRTHEGDGPDEAPRTEHCAAAPAGDSARGPDRQASAGHRDPG